MSPDEGGGGAGTVVPDGSRAAWPVKGDGAAMATMAAIGTQIAIP